MSAVSFQPRRSLIFVPGDKPEMFSKALRTGADIVAIDLEDAIAPLHKTVARERTLPYFGTPDGHNAGGDAVERVVRINCLRSIEGIRDVTAIINCPLPPKALMLAKVRTADEVKLLDDLLTEAGMNTRLHVIIESNDGLENSYAIARASTRIDALLFGGVDLSAELRTSYGWDNLVYARAKTVHAAAAAGVDLIDTPWLDLADMDGMRREAEKSAALGFTGKGAIHPKQIAALNEIFGPQPAQVARARQIVKAFAESDSGLVVIDGKLIEKPVLRSMQRLIALAERMSS